MKRAILLAGWGEEAAGRFSPSEYSVVSVPAQLVRRPFPAWQRRAAALDIELSASWLVTRAGVFSGGRSDAGLSGVAAGFRGVIAEVTDRSLPRVVERLGAEASRSSVLTDFATAAVRCERLRAAGRSIVFTNGVFDLFHVGHLRLLQAARALGGALVVGINSDESAKRLKGRARPAVSQFARAEIVAGVRGVDFCVIFGQSDPRALLQSVRPDILVKGSEYTVEGVVGHELVEEWGGRVQQVAHVQGWSSTGLIASLKRRKR